MKSLAPAFVDARGSITDVITNEQIDSVTIIRSCEGAIRGNHYHKETYQWTYILSGSITAVSKMQDEEPVTHVLSTGDLIKHVPYEQHAFLALEETEWLVLTRGPRGGKDYETDTFRLQIPLI
jgi:dTDP-4-dehydrorhamnose 3,5-epimerase-like enzyme